MTTYTAIPNGDIDADSPLTATLFQLLRDNPLAIGECDGSAPPNAAVWHATDGTTGAGSIYSGGVVDAVQTGLFADGWEYRLICREVTFTGNFFNINFEMLLNSTWYNCLTLNLEGASLSGTQVYNWDIFFPAPRISKRRPYAELNRADLESGSTLTSTKSIIAPLSDVGSTQKIDRFRLNTDSAEDFNTGNIYFQRRRDYLTD